MSMPLENHRPRDPMEDRQIDRLVDGELSGMERRQLLLQLETEPEGWRRCALAFLEAQCWREACGPLVAPARSAAPPVAIAAEPGSRAKSWRPVVRLTALAASLAAAFTLGWTLHRAPAEDAPQTPLARVERSAPTAPSGPAQPISDAAAAREPRQSTLEETPSPLEPIVKVWEQKGYRAEMQKRRVSMQLEDGRKLEVPVHEVRLQYVGNRIY